MTTAARFGGQRGGIQAAVLTEADIGLAATAVAKRTGLDRLTVKAVADELGITSPALYYHISGRQALLELVVSHVVGANFSDQLQALPDEEWVATLTRVLGRVTGMANQYPGVIAYVLGDHPAVSASRDVSAFVVRQLRRGGFSVEQAAYGYAAICALVGGWSLVAPSAPTADDDAHTGLAEVLTAAHAISAEQRLSVALDALLTGLRTTLPALVTTPKRRATRPRKPKT